jgi:hypothetical protein
MAKTAATTAEQADPPHAAHSVYFNPPAQDEEFVFTDVASLPLWADKNWAGVDDSSGEPVLHVPGMTYPVAQPYHTNIASVGDTVKWDSASGRLVIVPGESVPEGAAKPAAEAEDAEEPASAKGKKGRSKGD